MTSFNLFTLQVFMLDKVTRPKNFEELNPIDRDLTMFTITNLSLAEEDNTNLVYMSFKLKRRVSNELLTTYLPTSLLLLISFVSIFFERELLGYVLAVNLALILVMTIIFTSKMEELPTTSDTKMIDLWMIFCLVVPILEVILRTSTLCLTCSCHSCEAISANMTRNMDEKKDVESSALPPPPPPPPPPPVEVTRIWIGTGAKVAPKQVVPHHCCFMVRKKVLKAILDRFWSENRKNRLLLKQAKIREGAIMWSRGSAQSDLSSSQVFS